MASVPAALARVNINFSSVENLSSENTYSALRKTSDDVLAILIRQAQAAAISDLFPIHRMELSISSGDLETEAIIDEYNSGESFVLSTDDKSIIISECQSHCLRS